MRSRVRTASVAAVALLVAAAMFHASRGADATQGQPVIAGISNSESAGTTLCWVQGADSCANGNGFSVWTDQTDAVDGLTSKVGAIGVKGESSSGTGVYGTGTYAVHGQSDTGWGVWGEGSD